MTAELRVLCRRCGKETPSRAADHTGLCVICVTSDDVAPLRSEYERLWAKRRRYLAAGVNLRPVESQLATVARRLGDRVHRRIASPEQAIAILNAHLEDARNHVERGSSCIVLPKPGYLLAADA